MSKRIISILVVCVLALACVFADSIDSESSKGYFAFNAAPSSYQWMKVNEDVYQSTDGFAGSVGYVYNAWKGLEIGADVDFSGYDQYKIANFGSYYNLGLLLKAGWKFQLSEKVFAGAGLGLGYEASLIGKKFYSAVCAELYGKVGFAIDDTFALVAGANAKASIQKDFYALTVSPTIGVTVTL